MATLTTHNQIVNKIHIHEFMLATYNNVKLNFATPNIQQSLRRQYLIKVLIKRISSRDQFGIGGIFCTFILLFFHISKLTTIQKSIDSSPFSLHSKLLSACQS